MRLLLVLALLIGAKAKKPKKPAITPGMECEASKEIPTSSGDIKLIPAGAVVKITQVGDDDFKVSTAAGNATVKKKPFLSACKLKASHDEAAPKDTPQ